MADARLLCLGLDGCPLGGFQMDALFVDPGCFFGSSFPPPFGHNVVTLCRFCICTPSLFLVFPLIFLFFLHC